MGRSSSGRRRGLVACLAYRPRAPRSAGGRVGGSVDRPASTTLHPARWRRRSGAALVGWGMDARWAIRCPHRAPKDGSQAASVLALRLTGLEDAPTSTPKTGPAWPFEEEVSRYRRILRR